MRSHLIQDKYHLLSVALAVSYRVQSHSSVHTEKYFQGYTHCDLVLISLFPKQPEEDSLKEMQQEATDKWQRVLENYPVCCDSISKRPQLKGLGGKTLHQVWKTELQYGVGDQESNRTHKSRPILDQDYGTGDQGVNSLSLLGFPSKNVGGIQPWQVKRQAQYEHLSFFTYQG